MEKGSRRIGRSSPYACLYGSVLSLSKGRSGRKPRHGDRAATRAHVERLWLRLLRDRGSGRTKRNRSSGPCRRTPLGVLPVQLEPSTIADKIAAGFSRLLLRSPYGLSVSLQSLPFRYCARKPRIAVRGRSRTRRYAGKRTGFLPVLHGRIPGRYERSCTGRTF